jgi:hypothetical protein
VWSEASLARGVTRASDRVDNTVLRKVQARLDIEEARLSRRELVDWPTEYGVHGDADMHDDQRHHLTHPGRRGGTAHGAARA